MPPLTAEGLLRWMDAGDVAQAVLLTLINPEASSPYLAMNRRANFTVPLLRLDWPRARRNLAPWPCRQSH